MEDTQSSLRYKLAQGSQVREEDFGLLFYTKSGPRLFFVSSGGLIGSEFFRGEMTLADWLKQTRRPHPVPDQVVKNITIELDRLCRKGVLIGV